MEAKGTRWTRCIAMAAGIATLMATAGIAAARLTSQSGSVTIAPQQNGTATAKCGSGSAAVAGGFAAPGLDPTADTGPAILTFASNMSGDREWEASGHNFHNPAPSPKVDAGAGPLLAYAYCDKHDPSVTVRSKSTTVAGGGHASLTPKCARGSEAVSGGFRSDAPAQNDLTAFAYTSKRSGDRGWTIAVQNPDMSSHSVKAFAYCERHGPDLVTRTASKQFPSLGTASATAKCPKGDRVFSGGYQSTFDQSGNALSYALAFTSKRAAGDKWKVSAIRVVLNSASTGTKETAIAYCAT